MVRRFQNAELRKEQEVPLRASVDDVDEAFRSSDEEYDRSGSPTYGKSGYETTFTSGARGKNAPASRSRGRGNGRRGFLSQCLRPRRTCTLISLIFIAAIVLLLAGSGTWVYKTAPKDGESPPWYPSPLGGTASSWQESYAKAEALVKSMSLVEKVNVTTGVGWMGDLCVGNTGHASEAGFPALCLQDGPLGIRFADRSTAFPAGITTGATWNRELMYLRGRAQGLEARLKGVNVLLGPNMGPLGRMPAGGRNWEGFGPDPVLQAVAAAAVIHGIQDEGVMATAKHFILNEQEHFRQSFEWGLPNAMSSNIDDRTLHELYVWPFAESVRAGVASVMCSYQMVNNSYACGNSKLLNGILKDELGFQGFVQSDWLAQRSGVASALAGLDMTMPGDGLRWQDGNSLWGPQLTLAVLNGSVPLSRINDMATRIVAAWYQLGQDDKEKWPALEDGGGPNFSSWTDDEIGLLHPGTDDNTTGVVNKFLDVQGKGQDSHGSLARKIAAEGTVLVKNEHNILPLSPQGKIKNSASASAKYRVAVFGEDAGEGRGRNACPDRGCNEGTLASGWGSGAVEFPYLVTPIEALRSAFDPEHVELSEHLTNEVPAGDADAVEHQDLCLVFVNSDGGEGYISWNGIRGDRNDLYLQKDGDKLVQTVAQRCGSGSGGSPSGNTIVIVHAVGPVVLERWIDLPGVKAVLLANLPGEESGNALVDILFGHEDASGRLPYTVGKSLEEYGPGGQILYYPNAIVPQQNFSEGLFVDYRHFDKYNISPRYEFGFGLSYTNFTLSNLVITPLKSKSPFPAARSPSDILPPRYDETIPSPETALFPPGFRRLHKYIYPYISSTKHFKHPRGKPYPYPPGYDTPAPLSPAGGAPGGNPSLWDVHAQVNVTLTNTGSRKGKQVVQFYVSYPEGVVDPATGTVEAAGAGTGKSESGEKVNFPVKVLRGFEKLELDPGQSTTVTLNLTRKDLSYWSTRNQNWVMPVTGNFGVHVGTSSRDLPLAGEY